MAERTQMPGMVIRPSTGMKLTIEPERFSIVGSITVEIKLQGLTISALCGKINSMKGILKAEPAKDGAGLPASLLVPVKDVKLRPEPSTLFAFTPVVKIVGEDKQRRRIMVMAFDPNDDDSPLVAIPLDRPARPAVVVSKK